ncbi:MAG: metal ABC transporter ATP-binding protein [bacterium]|nr:metal ABC transporter ATP-binding protein [bacterium]
MRKNALATFSEITVTYPRAHALENISCYIERQSLLAIAGPNGGGKSTFLKVATNILKPNKGSCHFHNIHKHKDIAYLPQISGVNDTVPVTIEDVVSCGLFARKGFWKGLNAEDHEKISHALEQVGLAKFRHQLFHELSGGQRQRTLFARGIVQDAPLILLDEPFAAVDPYTRNDLMEIILSWYKQGRTVVAVLHDLPLIQEFFPETLLLCRSFVRQGPTSSVLTPQNMADARAALTEERGDGNVV